MGNVKNLLINMELVLYSTSHCHLCDQAEALLIKLALKYKLNWKIIEITDNPILYEQYEIKIPVLKRLDTNTEIYWPFNEDDIKLFNNLI
jgi:hypothetical protein